MKQEALYSIALTRVLPRNSHLQRVLLDNLGSAQEVYAHRHSLRDVMPDATDVLTKALAHMDEHLDFAVRELEYVQKEGIACLCQNDPLYPARLRECDDAPIVIFYKGTADLNTAHVLSIVGTRHCTEYGRSFCRHFVKDLASLCPGVLVVSGLAYGIDVAAHRAAMANGLPTMAVLAHGLEQIYPPLHQPEAKQMTANGGLLTEYTSYSNIDKMNFVNRNRIVAGLADAVIVVESHERGGSLITARIANDYNRDVFAVPGRVRGVSSAGCNKMIWDNKAAIMPASASAFLMRMGWETTAEAAKPVQREMFLDMSDEEKRIISVLQKYDEGVGINQLNVYTNLPIPRLTSLLFEMEMKGIIKKFSGGRYMII